VQSCPAGHSRPQVLAESDPKSILSMKNSSFSWRSSRTLTRLFGFRLKEVNLESIAVETCWLEDYGHCLPKLRLVTRPTREYMARDASVSPTSSSLHYRVTGFSIYRHRVAAADICLRSVLLLKLSRLLFICLDLVRWLRGFCCSVDSRREFQPVFLVLKSKGRFFYLNVDS